MKKHIMSFLVFCLLFLGIGVTAHAHPVPDLENGSITFEISWEGNQISGGTLSIYRVGDIVEDDGNYSFGLITELKDSELSLEDIEDAGLAKDLAKLAKDKNLNAITVSIKDGKAAFTDVVPGLYVVVQNQASPGYEAMSPFLISMPRFEDGKYENDITAKPKVSLETAPPETPEEENPEGETPDGETPGPEPSKTPGTTLPQTGQLNWPVPLLAVLGLCLFVVGWVLCFRQKKESYEK